MSKPKPDTPGATPSVEPRAAPKTSRTRRALLEAGRRLIFSGRMDDASIDDIVREADVAKGSFFNHFANRQELTAQVMAGVRSELEAVVLQANENVDDVLMRMARGMLAALQYGLENGIGAHTMLFAGPSASEPDAHPLLVDDLRQGMASGRLKLDDVEAGLVLVLGLSELGMSRLLDLRHDHTRAREAMRGIVLLLLRALGETPQRCERIADAAVRAIVDLPRAQRQR